jgi:hypothetical protein
MNVARFTALSLGIVCATGAAACGSNGVDQFGGYHTGGPATPIATHGDAGDAGTASSSGGGSSSGGSSSGSSGGSSGSSSGGSTNPDNPNAASFTLIDTKIVATAAGSPVQGFDPIPSGATIDLGKVGIYLSIRANMPAAVTAVGSVAFALDATFTHTSSAVPYSMCGDDGKGTFTPCVMGVGEHTLTVTIYPEADLGGSPYQPPTVFDFTVVDSALDGGSDAAAD